MRSLWREALRRGAGAWRAARGATTAEYALLLALVVVILIGALSQLGQALNAKLGSIINSINQAR